MKLKSEENLKSKVFSGLFWKFLENGGVQVIQFVVQIIIARILSPNDYGSLTLIMVFISIANMFVNSGFGAALIQKKEVDETDFSSVFYLNLGVSIVLYIVLFFTSPFIANFYNDFMLIPVIRVLSITIIFGAINTIHNATLSRKMKFKKSFLVQLGGNIASGVVGISMAFMGFGVWSLVFSIIASTLVGTIILWYTVKWQPKLLFSLSKLRRMFKYSSNILVSGLIEVISNNLYSLVIGKLYNNQMLGYYNRGQNIPNLVVSNINSPITAVMFPALSHCQGNKHQFKNIVRRSVVTSCFIVFPIMVGLACISEPLTILLLTDKWLPSVPFMQLSCITFAFWPIHTANVEAISAMGRSDICLKLQVIKKTILISALVITIPFGIYTMMIGSIFTSIISTFINAWPNKSLFNYSVKEQWTDISPSLLLALAMGTFVYGFNLFDLNPVVTILLQVITGALIYIGCAYMFRFECFIYLIKNIKFKR
jgi:O-antigen/teichoic acid export membrane protein